MVVSVLSGLKWCKHDGGVVRSLPSATLTYDASGSWGCVAYTYQGQLFMVQWPTSWATFHIMLEELLPIVLAVAMLGQEWKGRSIHCQCDSCYYEIRVVQVM